MVTLSRVMTGCGGRSMYCSRRSMEASPGRTFVQYHAQLGANLVALRERVVQVHVAHHGAHPCDGQLHDAAHEVCDFVDGLNGVGDLPVDD